LTRKSGFRARRRPGKPPRACGGPKNGGAGGAQGKCLLGALSLQGRIRKKKVPLARKGRIFCRSGYPASPAAAASRADLGAGPQNLPFKLKPRFLLWVFLGFFS